MGDKRRAELAAAGNTSPYSTFTNTGSGLSRTAAERDRKPAPKQPRNTGPSAETVTLLFRRDQGRCARCGDPIRGERGRDWSVQHRRARQGRDLRPDTNQPPNLVLLDGSATTGCHGHVESRRAEARVNGWAIRQTDNPAEVPVNHAVHGWVLLTPDGDIQTYSPNHTNQQEVTA
ncbi:MULTISPECIES: hypothetical protein [unclassified Micromonospora]|uniref:hypothetical protein n=1 Tax=unclassified Micromonospora TaxID=2617518 RepID=UPI00332732DD